MAFQSFIRVARSGRRAASATTQPPAAPAPVEHRHPAMTGLNVSPVHGRHCICDRCSPEERERQLPLAG